MTSSLVSVFVLWSVVGLRSVSYVCAFACSCAVFVCVFVCLFACFVPFFRRPFFLLSLFEFLFRLLVIIHLASVSSFVRPFKHSPFISYFYCLCEVVPLFVHFSFISSLCFLFVCLFVCLQNEFSRTPYILVTAEHGAVDLKHDAATVWIENANANSFKICLRELQNFDGLHETVLVVSRLLSIP